jgi:hypothetical protein
MLLPPAAAGCWTFVFSQIKSKLTIHLAKKGVSIITPQA